MSVGGTKEFGVDLLPPCLLYDYVDALTESTRAPAALHCFSAISAIGGLFGRKLRLLRGGEHPVDTTQSAVLVAPSGEGKGTAMGAASRWLTSTVPSYPIIGGKATMEGILANLDPEYARGLVLAPELGAMFGQQKFRASFDQEMTDALDNQDLYRWTLKSNKDKEEAELRNMSLTFLAGTTKQWMTRCMTGTALEEGFASRVLWVLCVEPPRDRDLPPSVPGWDSLCLRLRQIYDCYRVGKIELAKPPQAFKKWMTDHYDTLPPDPWQRGWWNRKPSMLLQLSLIFSILLYEGRTAPDIPNDAMWAADALLEWNEPGMTEILTSLGGGPGSQKLRKLLSRLAEYKEGVSDSEFNIRVWHITEGMKGTRDMLRQMEEMGWADSSPGKVTLPSGKISSKALWAVTKQGRETLR